MPTNTMPPPKDWLPQLSVTSRLNTIRARLPFVERNRLAAFVRSIVRECRRRRGDLVRIYVPRAIVTALSDGPVDALGAGTFHGVPLDSTCEADVDDSFELSFSGWVPQTAQDIVMASESCAPMRSLPLVDSWLPRASMRAWLYSMSIEVDGVTQPTLASFIEQLISGCRARNLSLLSIGVPGPLVRTLADQTVLGLDFAGTYRDIGLYCHEWYPLASMVEINFYIAARRRNRGHGLVKGLCPDSAKFRTFDL